MGNGIVGSIISNIGNIASFIGSRISSQQPVVTGTSLAYDAAVGTGLDTLFAGSVRVTTNGPVPVPFVPPPVSPATPPVPPVVVSISTLSQPQPLINLPTPCQTYEKWGIHTTLFLVSTWLVVASSFYMAAWYFASQASQQQDDDDDISLNPLQHANQRILKKRQKRTSTIVNDLSPSNSLYRHRNLQRSHIPLHNHNSNHSSIHISNSLLKSNEKGLPTSILGSIAARMGLATNNNSINVVNKNNSSSNLKQPLLDDDLSRIGSESSSFDRENGGEGSATTNLNITWT